jgi:hypothetical protein
MSAPNTNLKLQEIESIKTNFYNENSKKTFFSKSQKFECANTVCERIDIDDLLYHTSWIVPNTNKVYFDYTVFKQYASPENFILIVNDVLAKCMDCSCQFNMFEVHVNLSSFTITAAERYKSIIELFCNECFRRDTRFTEKLSTFNLYNIPTMIENISRMLLPLIPPEVKPKLKLFTKQESQALLTKLHNPSV